MLGKTRASLAFLASFLSATCGTFAGLISNDSASRAALERGRAYTRISPALGGEDLYKVVWTGAGLVAIGENGTILASPEGHGWKRIEIPNFHADLRELAWSGKVLVAAGDSQWVVSNDSGKTWTVHQDGEGYYSRLLWAGTRFAMKDSWSAGFFTSPDGVEWTQVLPPKEAPESYGTAIAWTGRHILWVKEKHSWRLEDDGRWTRLPGAHSIVFNVVQAAGLMATSCWGDCFFEISRDSGRSWKNLSRFCTGPRSLLHDGSRWVAVGTSSSYCEDHDPGGGIQFSHDGEHWQNPDSVGGYQPNDLAWTGSLWVGVGGSGHIFSSPDLKTWTRRDPLGPFDDGPDRVSGGRTVLVWTGKRHVLLGQDEMFTSDDSGSTWRRVAAEDVPGLEDLMHLTWTGARLVAVGRGGLILVSPDGSTWTKKYSGTRKDLNFVKWTGKGLVAVGDTGVVLLSADGEQWSARNAGTRTDLGSVAWTGSVLAALGDAHEYDEEEGFPRVKGREQSAVFTSRDHGLTWTRQPLRPSGLGWGEIVAMGPALAVFYGDSTFVLQPGGEWKGISVGYQPYRGYQWTGTKLLALGHQGLHSTRDGVTWRPEVLFSGRFGASTFTWRGPRTVFVGMGTPSTLILSPLGERREADAP